MPLKVTPLVVLMLSQCWAAPQRRHWTPQAILYLKGARHRSALERSSREEGDTLHLVNQQIDDGRGSSLDSFILLELLQRAVEKGGGQT
ncbi:spexin prohormone 1-like isoform 2-T2 [Odontesthes bonariensis]